MGLLQDGPLQVIYIMESGIEAPTSDRNMAARPPAKS